jgi:hypothetical protein
MAKRGDSVVKDVKPFGTGAHVIVPKDWTDCTVKVVVTRKNPPKRYITKAPWIPR